MLLLQQQKLPYLLQDYPDPVVKRERERNDKFRSSSIRSESQRETQRRSTTSPSFFPLLSRETGERENHTEKIIQDKKAFTRAQEQEYDHKIL